VGILEISSVSVSLAQRGASPYPEFEKVQTFEEPFLRSVSRGQRALNRGQANTSGVRLVVSRSVLAYPPHLLMIERHVRRRVGCKNLTGLFGGGFGHVVNALAVLVSMGNQTCKVWSHRPET